MFRNKRFYTKLISDAFSSINSFQKDSFNINLFFPEHIFDLIKKMNGASTQKKGWKGT